jgi:serine/threonine protein phosphatase 1
MLKWLLRSSSQQAVRPQVPEGQRVYAIGDVHGRLDLLDALLGMIEADNASRDMAEVALVFLGDLIDRGPDSRGTLDRVRSGFDWAHTVSLMGNHEAVLLAALGGQQDVMQSWLRFGGRETLASWGIEDSVTADGTTEEIIEAARAAISPEEREWIGSMRSHVQIGDYYFVHAGIRPGMALGKQTDRDRLWIREPFLNSRRDHGVIVVHGHTIREEVEEMPNRIGLDTGAYRTGKLTAIGLEQDDRWFLTTT